MSATSEVIRKGGSVYRYYVRNRSEVGSSYATNRSICDERRDPVNAPSQLVTSLLAASHLSEWKRLQDDRPVLEEETELL